MYKFILVKPFLFVFYLDEIKVAILTEMGKILNSTPESDLPDDFIEIVGCVEIDTKFLKKDFDADKRKKALEVILQMLIEITF